MSWSCYEFDDYDFDTPYTMCVDEPETPDCHSQKSQNLFYHKNNTTPRKSNLSWTFTANFQDYQEIQTILHNISNNSNKAYVVLNEQDNTLYGYFSLKEKLPECLLRNKIGDGLTYTPACGGCNDNKKYLEGKLKKPGYNSILDLGYSSSRSFSRGI